MNRAKTNTETTDLFSAIKSLQRKARPNAQKIKINGNITSLHRKGLQVSGNNYDRDKIDYIYSTTDNKLQRVTDAVTTGTDDFNTGGSTADYSYNQMGQLTASVADNAGNISYYSNGLTKQITQTNGDKVNYYYNERGQRIKSEFTAGGATERDITWYVNGAGGNIQAIYHYDEAAQQAGQLTEQPVYGVGGRMGVYKRAENRTLYEIKDHLGNVRATVGKDVDGNIGVDMWADYYPFGGVMPGRNGKPGDYRFGYQGQEQAVDSRWSNFKLRMYSADLGRFMSIDPYGQYHSPYLAMADNPVSYIDPDGGYGYGLGFEIRRKWALFEIERAYLSSIANRRVEDYSSRHQLNDAQFYIDGMWVSQSTFQAYMKSGVTFDYSNSATGEVYQDLAYTHNGFVQEQQYEEGYLVGNETIGYIKKDVKVVSEYVSVDANLNAGMLAGGEGNELKTISNQGQGGNVIERLYLEQANEHYRNGNGTPLTVDASKIDLSNVDPNALGPVNGRPITVNLSPNSRDGLVYGKLDLINRGNGKVEILPNSYDFITSDHPWFEGNFLRNTFTVIGNVLAGPGTPYMINFQGYGDLNYTPEPYVPQIPTGPKY